MRISVLTMAWNAAATIRHTLDSFLAQDHADKEMILVDGASTDGTAEIAESYGSEAIRVLSEPDDGMYDALNKALDLYTGNAVGVLNADDAYHDSSALSRIAEALRGSDIVYGHVDFVADHDAKTVTRRWRAAPRPTGGFRTGWMPAHPTFYVRRAVAQAVGPFDLSLATAADYDWMLRAVELFGFSSSMMDHVLVDMQTGGRSTAGPGAYIRHNVEALRSRRRWLGAGLVDYALVAKPLRKIGQFVRPPALSRRSA